MDMPSEWEYWEKFCSTGAVADYLAYREADRQRDIPAEYPEDDAYADDDGRFGY